jgi:long-chain acyl-CoA synthetase
VTALPVRDDDYAALRDHARRVAASIVASRADGRAGAPARYVLRESARLVACTPDEGATPPPVAAVEALDLVHAGWDDIRGGAVSGEELFGAAGDLWARLMNDWPMGAYAELAARAFAAADGPAGAVVELGAGVGATTRRLRPLVEARGGALLATDVAYGPGRAIDFDRPLADQLPAADAVVATNALHCARDPEQTLRWIAEILRPGGLLVLAEGAPWPEPGVPWALNLLFGVFRGWYDRGGFRSSAFWLDALGRAGFEAVGHDPVPSHRYELGGCICARRRDEP